MEHWKTTCFTHPLQNNNFSPQAIKTRLRLSRIIIRAVREEVVRAKRKHPMPMDQHLISIILNSRRQQPRLISYSHLAPQWLDPKMPNSLQIIPINQQEPALCLWEIILLIIKCRLNLFWNLTHQTANSMRSHLWIKKISIGFSGNQMII